jgi:uncharacterized protein with NRDE domain
VCLLVFAWKMQPGYRLILAANRDELHARAASPLAAWPDAQILGGRDLAAGGTWLAIDRRRRFGIVTNFREGPAAPAGAPSRGALIPGYLRATDAPQAWFAHLKRSAPSYAGFNLLLGDEQELWYASNRAADFARKLEPGVFGLSNRLLDTPWPKLIRTRARFEDHLRQCADPDPESLLAMLNDRDPGPASDDAYPADVPAEWQRALSAPFVLNSVYGTRCSTVLLLQESGAVRMIERRFDRTGARAGDTRIELNSSDW